MDELDYLMNKDQSVLYNLFEWPQRKNANLIVISVANTLDLPETFMARISSRIGNTRLVFTPYTSSEIRTIINQRVNNAQIFDNQALEFISKKVAMISSDIRKTLMICRQAVEKFRDEWNKRKQTDPDQAPNFRITLSFVNKVFENAYQGSPLTDFLLQANEIVCMFLTELYQELKFTSSKVASYRKIYERYRNASSSSLERYSAHELLILTRRLKERAIVDISHNSKSDSLDVHLLCNLDELAYALKDNPYFSKKVVV